LGLELSTGHQAAPSDPDPVPITACDAATHANADTYASAHADSYHATNPHGDAATHADPGAVADSGPHRHHGRGTHSLGKLAAGRGISSSGGDRPDPAGPQCRRGGAGGYTESIPDIDGGGAGRSALAGYDAAGDGADAAVKG